MLIFNNRTQFYKIFHKIAQTHSLPHKKAYVKTKPQSVCKTRHDRQPPRNCTSSTISNGGDFNPVGLFIKPTAHTYERAVQATNFALSTEKKRTFHVKGTDDLCKRSVLLPKKVRTFYLKGTLLFEGK